MALFKHSALVISINSLSQTQTCNHILCHYRPMGAFGSDRFSFAATFGALTYLCFEIAVKRHYVVRNANHGPFNVQSKCCQLYYQEREREGEREREHRQQEYVIDMMKYLKSEIYLDPCYLDVQFQGLSFPSLCTRWITFPCQWLWQTRHHQEIFWERFTSGR